MPRDNKPPPRVERTRAFFPADNVSARIASSQAALLRSEKLLAETAELARPASKLR